MKEGGCFTIYYSCPQCDWGPKDKSYSLPLEPVARLVEDFVPVWVKVEEAVNRVLSGDWYVFTGPDPGYWGYVPSQMKASDLARLPAFLARGRHGNPVTRHGSLRGIKLYPAVPF